MVLRLLPRDFPHFAISGYNREVFISFCGSAVVRNAGLLFRVNGDRYEGEWRNGRMHGKGVKVMANGDVYNGTWENDKAEGNGVKVR